MKIAEKYDGGSVEIEIKSSANDTKKAIDGLVISLNASKKQLQSFIPIFKSIHSLANGLKSITMLDTGKLESQIPKITSSLSLMNTELSKSDFMGFTQKINQATTSVTSFVKSYERLGQLDATSITNSMNNLSNLKMPNISKDMDMNKLKDMDMSKLKDSQITLKSFSSSLNKINQLDLGLLKQQFSDLSPTLDKFVTSLSSINSTGFKGITSLLNALKNIPVTMQKMTTLDFTAVGKAFSTLNTQIQPFLASLKEASAELQAFAIISNNTGKSTGKATNNVTSLNKESVLATKSLNGMFNVGKIYFMLNSLKRVSNAITKMMGSAIDFVETVNLMQVSFGELSTEALKFQNTLSEAFGLAMPELMRFQATFNNLLKSLGKIPDTMAYGLSESLTKMAIDFASIFNTTIESAMTKFQSALTQQVRPIRSTSGFDITQNTLQEVIESIGIYNRGIRSLSQTEKRLVTIIALSKQMANVGAMGDFARTIEAPAQQLKILQAQLKETGRWIGQFAMTYITPILPYINGFVMVIKELVKSLAMLVGYKMPQFNNVDDILETDDAVGGLDDVEDSIKRVKTATAGIDELNVISQDTGDTGNTGKDGYESVAIDPRILQALNDYDNKMNDVRMKATAIRDRILEWLGLTKSVDLATGEISFKLPDGITTNLHKILDLVKAIGSAFIGWKIGNWIVNTLTDADNGTGRILKKLGNQLFPNFFNNANAFAKRLYPNMLENTKLSNVKQLGIGLGVVGGVFALAIAKSETFRKGLTTIAGGLKNIVVFIKDIFVRALDIIHVPELFTDAMWTGLGFVILGVAGAIVTAFAPVTGIILIIGSIIGLVITLIGQLNSVPDPFDALNGTSAQTKDNLEEIIPELESLDRALMQVDYSTLAVTPEIQKSISTSLENIVNDVTAKAKTLKENAMTTLNDLFQGGGFSMVEQQEMLASVDVLYSETLGKITSAQTEINSIIARAQTANRDLLESEITRLSELEGIIQESTIGMLTDTQTDMEILKRNFNTNMNLIDAQQTSIMLKSLKTAETNRQIEIETSYQKQLHLASEYKKNSNKALQEQGKMIEQEAKKMYDIQTGLNKQTYVDMIKQIAKERPNLISQVNLVTGEILTAWDKIVNFFQYELDVHISNGLNWVLKHIKGFFNSIEQLWENALNGLIDSWNNLVKGWKIPDALKKVLTIEGRVDVTSDNAKLDSQYYDQELSNRMSKLGANATPQEASEVRKQLDDEVAKTNGSAWAMQSLIYKWQQYSAYDKVAENKLNDQMKSAGVFDSKGMITGQKETTYATYATADEISKGNDTAVANYDVNKSAYDTAVDTNTATKEQTEAFQEYANTTSKSRTGDAGIINIDVTVDNKALTEAFNQAFGEKVHLTEKSQDNMGNVWLKEQGMHVETKDNFENLYNTELKKFLDSKNQLNKPVFDVSKDLETVNAYSNTKTVIETQQNQQTKLTQDMLNSTFAQTQKIDNEILKVTLQQNEQLKQSNELLLQLLRKDTSIQLNGKEIAKEVTKEQANFGDIAAKGGFAFA